MLINILTFLTKMNKLMTISRFCGSFLTVAFTIAYHLTALEFGFTIAVGWLWVFAVAGAFIGGRRAGLVAAAWAGLYAYYVMPDGDWPLTIQRVIIGFLLAGVVGWQAYYLRWSLAETREALALARQNQDKADFVDTLNGNILKLLEVIDVIDQTIDITKSAKQPELTKQLIDIRVRLADLTTRAKGWHTLAKSRGFVLGESDGP